MLEPVQSVEIYAQPIPAASSAAATSPGSGASAGAGASSSSGPFASLPAIEPEPGWNAVYYDSPRSLTPKLLLADERGLAGAGFWAIGYERGLPDYTELIATFRAGDLKAP